MLQHNIEYRILVRKPLENRSHRRPAIRCEANIKTDLREMAVRIDVDQEQVHSQDLVLVTLSLQILLTKCYL
jgi:hypothetical protein